MQTKTSLGKGLNEITQWYETSIGMVTINILGCAIFGGAIHLIFKKIADRLGLYKSEKRKKIIENNAELASYLGNIGMGVFLSFYLYGDRSFIMGFIYGLGAIVVQNIIFDGFIFKVIRAWRHKK